MSATTEITYTEPPRKCTICCEEEREDKVVYTCDVCGDPVCSADSDDGPDNSVVCDNCVAAGKASRSRVARFKLSMKIDGADGCTITIDTGAGTFSVRPKRRRRAYTLPLGTVAERVVHSIARAETLAKQKAKKQRRKLVSRRRS